MAERYRGEDEQKRVLLLLLTHHLETHGEWADDDPLPDATIDLLLGEAACKTCGEVVAYMDLDLVNS